MKKRGVLIGLIIVLAIGLLAGCSNEKKDVVSENEDSLKIGFSFYSMVIERWQRERDIFVSEAQGLGATVNTQNANGNLDKQKKQIEYLINQEMDVIVIVATDTKNLADSVKAAKEKGIKVIAYDRLIENAGVDLFVTFDSEKVGQIMGQQLVKKFPSGGNIIKIWGSPTDHNVELLDKGVTDVLPENKFKVLSKSYAKDWLAEHAFDVITEYYNSGGGDLDAIICGNDDLATQAVRALSEQRLAGRVYVIGQDGDLIACQRIVEGTQAGTVFKNTDQLAKRAAEAAVQLAKGETVNSDGQISDGSVKVPYLYLQPVFVNRKNIEDVVIASGFHSKEDVYLNE